MPDPIVHILDFNGHDIIARGLQRDVDMYGIACFASVEEAYTYLCFAFGEGMLVLQPRLRDALKTGQAKARS